MGAQRTSFEKLQRDRAKKAKAAAKRERRHGGDARQEPSPEETPAPLPADSQDGELSAAELLQRIEDIHRRFDAKQISFEEFEEEKAELMRRLPID